MDTCLEVSNDPAHIDPLTSADATAGTSLSKVHDVCSAALKPRSIGDQICFSRPYLLTSWAVNSVWGAAWSGGILYRLSHQSFPAGIIQASFLLCRSSRGVHARGSSADRLVLLVNLQSCTCHQLAPTLHLGGILGVSSLCLVWRLWVSGLGVSLRALIPLGSLHAAHREIL